VYTKLKGVVEFTVTPCRNESETRAEAPQGSKVIFSNYQLNAQFLYSSTICMLHLSTLSGHSNK